MCHRSRLDEKNQCEDRDDVCAAIATPPGQSGLAVIRLSGQGCAEMVEPVFKANQKRFLLVSQMPGYTCAVGDLIDPEDHRFIDRVVLTRYMAPRSYTGEDMIELSCHGGRAVKQAILALIFRQGARPAEPGEFTLRAFLNGKMDLTQAEAVMDLIASEADLSARNAAAQMKGRLSKTIRGYMDPIYDMLAGIELALEYPDHDESTQDKAPLPDQLKAMAQTIQKHADTYDQGRFLHEGMTVVLAGRPNVGKSSLLNALAGYDRAIVTDIPGTTRDTVEEMVDISGVPIRLIDTAGLRAPGDTIEKMGVARTRKALEAADLVFWLLSPPLDDLDRELADMKQIKTAPLIPIVSKHDLDASAKLRERLEKAWPEGTRLTCSALTGDGLDQIRQVIIDTYEQSGVQHEMGMLVTNSRHQACLKKAAKRLQEAAETIENGLTLDITASMIRGALDALSELTGEYVSDELVNAIFSRFCVGK
jgi:tRNA modification GTPase